MSTRPENISALWNLVECVSTITCDQCSRKDEVEGDSMDAVEEFYDKGWRVGGNDVILCPTCKRKKKVKKK